MRCVQRWEQHPTATLRCEQGSKARWQRSEPGSPGPPSAPDGDSTTPRRAPGPAQGRDLSAHTASPHSASPAPALAPSSAPPATRGRASPPGRGASPSGAWRRSARGRRQARRPQLCSSMDAILALGGGGQLSAAAYRPARVPPHAARPATPRSAQPAPPHSATPAPEPGTPGSVVLRSARHAGSCSPGCCGDVYRRGRGERGGTVTEGIRPRVRAAVTRCARVGPSEPLWVRLKPITAHQLVVLLSAWVSQDVTGKKAPVCGVLGYFRAKIVHKAAANSGALLVLDVVGLQGARWSTNTGVLRARVSIFCHIPTCSKQCKLCHSLCFTFDHRDTGNNRNQTAEAIV